MRRYVVISAAVALGAFGRIFSANVALTGNLSETSFTDLIQFYSMSRQTAAVRIVSPAGPEHDGILYLEGAVGIALDPRDQV